MALVRQESVDMQLWCTALDEMVQEHHSEQQGAIAFLVRFGQVIANDKHCLHSSTTAGGSMWKMLQDDIDIQQYICTVEATLAMMQAAEIAHPGIKSASWKIVGLLALAITNIWDKQILQQLVLLLPAEWLWSTLQTELMVLNEAIYDSSVSSDVVVEMQKNVYKIARLFQVPSYLLKDTFQEHRRHLDNYYFNKK